MACFERPTARRHRRTGRRCCGPFPSQIQRLSWSRRSPGRRRIVPHAGNGPPVIKGNTGSHLQPPSDRSPPGLPQGAWNAGPCAKRSSAGGGQAVQIEILRLLARWARAPAPHRCPGLVSVSPGPIDPPAAKCRYGCEPGVVVSDPMAELVIAQADGWAGHCSHPTQRPFPALAVDRATLRDPQFWLSQTTGRGCPALAPLQDRFGARFFNGPLRPVEAALKLVGDRPMTRGAHGGPARQGAEPHREGLACCQ